MKKLIATGIIFLFIGVAVAPSINSSVAKTSNENDLIEVTSQACGIQGFGNTTVKLTKQQYQDLEQYLDHFGARLNQTTTREETVLLFKQTVVELNDYGLLPHGMSVRQAQRLIKPHETSKAAMDKAASFVRSSNYSNLFCLIAGKTTYCAAANLLMDGVRSLIYALLIKDHTEWLGVYFVLSVYLAILLSIRNYLCPLDAFSVLTFGGTDLFGNPFPSVGWISTRGLLGTKNQTGSWFGQLPFPVKDILGNLDSGVFGFTGLKIMFPNGANLFFGAALLISIGDSPYQNATR